MTITPPSPNKVSLSVVVPAHNEEDNIVPFFQELQLHLEKSPVIDKYEVLFVDDGSTDHTLARMMSLNSPSLKVLRGPKPQGKTAALFKGFETSQYDLLLTLDSDMQNDPADIDPMIQLYLKGCDFIQGVRGIRKDPFFKKLTSKLANSIRRWVLNDTFLDINCGVRLFKKECLNKVEAFEGLHRFLPLLVRQIGFNVCEITVTHRPRLHGKSKYSTRNRVLKTAYDLLVFKFFPPK